MPETLIDSSPWQRLLRYVTIAMQDKNDGFNFATGMDFGFAIAIDHPEYAVAMRRAIQGGMPGRVNTEKLVDAFVKAVPIELRDTGEEKANVLS